MILHYELKGNGETVVFLHGLSASLRCWQPFIGQLDSSKYQTLAIDLLGFGHSPKPRNLEYNYDDHLISILETLKAAGIKGQITIVAHSMGGLIALRLAANHPELVKKLIIYGLPFLPTPEITKHEITKGKLNLRLAYYGPISHVLCSIWCRFLRPLSKHLAPFYLPRLPKAVAEDSVLHTWYSYSKSRDNLIEDQQVAADLAKIKGPIILVYGENDRMKNYIEAENLLNNLNNVELKLIKDSGHNLPHQKPRILTSLV
jgi:pimeloyl-ACP methyl ester carboxylesterase